MIKKYILVIFLFIINQSIAGESLFYYLPDSIKYNDQIPKPASDKVSIEEYGKTYENKPLYVVVITSAENQENLEHIRKTHLKLTNHSESSQVDIVKEPLVLWLGYSVHGNESSGSNASLLLAYHLAAAENREINELLNNNIVLIDPCINPDGFNRFAHWANTNKSKVLNADPNDREHNEPWPNARTNHYWFDLNRDWLPLQHPESKGRMAKFHQWKPNVVTDHHEMGTNSTFFFQPGVPSRNHPLTPENTFYLTEKMADYHAQALDESGVLYYTKERFDDFYYGKGSTYPDINGAVGILFEQASSRGHLQESINGKISFPFTIRNQLIVSLSTLKAAHHLRTDLLEHQRNFFQQSNKEADSNPYKAYIFNAGKDHGRAGAFLEMLLNHQIEVYPLTKNINVNNNEYKTSNSFVVPLNQKQYKLIKAIFETRTTFEDSLFYDVSSWTFPLAFNLNYDIIPEKYYSAELTDKKLNEFSSKPGEIRGGISQYAYLFEWNSYFAPKLLYQLLDKGLTLKVATEPFSIADNKFERGSILIPVSLNKNYSPRQLFNELNHLSNKTNIDIYSIPGGLTSEGISLGSPGMKSLEKPKVFMIVGEGISTYEAGEVWHLLDQRYEVPVTRISVEELNNVDLHQYNTLVLVNGNYGRINVADQERIKRWIQQGGQVIAIKRAVQWLADNGLTGVNFIKDKADTATLQKPYASMKKIKDAQKINGSIFLGKMDITHPLCYGYNKQNINLFKNANIFMEPAKNPFSNPVLYTNSPLLSGYISEENLEKVKNSVAVNVSAYGNGKIISFADNPNFRAFWYGTNKIFANSLFFGQIIDPGSAR